MEPWSVDGAYVGYPTPKTQKKNIFFQKNRKTTQPEKPGKNREMAEKKQEISWFWGHQFFFDVNFKYLMVHTHSQVKIRPKLDQN